MIAWSQLKINTRHKTKPIALRNADGEVLFGVCVCLTSFCFYVCVMVSYELQHLLT